MTAAVNTEPLANHELARVLRRRYRRTGGNDQDLHAPAMENILVGLDIMPATTHLIC